jgi:hypothetical protein
VILDAWALLRLDRHHPTWTDALVHRIQQREFDRIVLVYSLDFRGWYSQIHLGESIATAIRDNYRLAGTADGYFVYVPAPRP